MEVKQFTQGQFANAFEGSAAEFLKQATPAVPATPATPAAAPATPPKEESPTDPLIPNPTLDEGRDAATLLNQQPETDPDEPADPNADPAAAKAAAEAAKKQSGRPPVKKLDATTKEFVEGLIKEKKLFG